MISSERLRTYFLVLFVLSGCCGCGAVVPKPETGEGQLIGGGTTLPDLQRDIFDVSCALANCHGSPLGGPMSLVDGDSYASLVGVPSTQLATMPRVTAGDPAASYVLFKLRGTAGSVGGRPTRMPLNRAPIPEEDIARIEAWIAGGANPE